MVTPVFATLNLMNGWMACTNLSGVVMGTTPRASMRIAPGGPDNRGSFKSSLTFQDFRQAGLPFTSSIFQQSQNQMG
jgi:hypothetical protein